MALRITSTATLANGLSVATKTFIFTILSFASSTFREINGGIRRYRFALEGDKGQLLLPTYSFKQAKHLAFISLFLHIISFYLPKILLTKLCSINVTFQILSYNQSKPVHSLSALRYSKKRGNHQPNDDL